MNPQPHPSIGSIWHAHPAPPSRRTRLLKVRAHERTPKCAPTHGAPHTGHPHPTPYIRVDIATSMAYGYAVYAGRTSWRWGGISWCAGERVCATIG